jgi:hypothetical protein
LGLNPARVLQYHCSLQPVTSITAARTTGASKAATLAIPTIR